jgi:hypothetical protein
MGARCDNGQRVICVNLRNLWTTNKDWEERGLAGYMRGFPIRVREVCEVRG